MTITQVKRLNSKTVIKWSQEKSNDTRESIQSPHIDLMQSLEDLRHLLSDQVPVEFGKMRPYGITISGENVTVHFQILCADESLITTNRKFVLDALEEAQYDRVKRVQEEGRLFVVEDKSAQLSLVPGMENGVSKEEDAESKMDDVDWGDEAETASVESVSA